MNVDIDSVTKKYSKKKKTRGGPILHRQCYLSYLDFDTLCQTRLNPFVNFHIFLLFTKCTNFLKSFKICRIKNKHKLSFVAWDLIFFLFQGKKTKFHSNKMS